jgi:hypothetical protein
LKKRVMAAIARPAFKPFICHPPSAEYRTQYRTEYSPYDRYK